MGGTFSRFWDQTYFIPKPAFTEKELHDQKGKVIIVTGGYTGIGKDLASLLYSRDATVYIAGRSESKASAAISALKSAHPASKGRLEFMQFELDDLTTIAPAVKDFLAKEDRLDVLVNNAGVMMTPEGSLGKQNYDLQLETNVLGPFLLTKLLAPLLQETVKKAPTASVRVLWAASSAVDLVAPSGGVPFDAAGAPVTKVSKEIMYGITKAANVLLGTESANRWGQSGIMSLSFNPGNLWTELQRHTSWAGLMALKLICHPSYLGAYTELFAGWSPAVTPVSNGGFIIPWGRIGTYNEALMKSVEDGTAKKLWEWCEKETSTYV